MNDYCRFRSMPALRSRNVPMISTDFAHVRTSEEWLFPKNPNRRSSGGLARLAEEVGGLCKMDGDADNSERSLDPKRFERKSHFSRYGLSVRSNAGRPGLEALSSRTHHREEQKCSKAHH